MNTNQKFALWCARKCLHLWEPPQPVIDWLNAEDKTSEIIADAYKAISAKPLTATTNITSESKMEDVISSRAQVATIEAIWSMRDSSWVGNVAEWTRTALVISEQELMLEFVSTWTDEELNTTDQMWIEYATIEIMRRAS